MIFSVLPFLEWFTLQPKFATLLLLLCFQGTRKLHGGLAATLASDNDDAG